MKRNNWKAVFALVLVAMLCICQMSAAFAASVEFKWSTGKNFHFDFKPGSPYSATDLFEFKEVLPGDTLTQEISFVNSQYGKIRLFMVADPTVLDEGNYGDWELNSIPADKHKELAILDYMTLKVKTNKGQNIFDAPANETAQLTDPVLLGTFKHGGRVTLELELTVDPAMPSSITLEDGTKVNFMDAMATIPWTFIAEELPDDDTPDTGDWFSMPVWIGLGVVLAAALVWLLVGWKKRKEA